MEATQRDSDSSSLSEAAMAADPMTQFARWMSDAEGLVRPDPTAMVLATTAADGRPRARTVLLKAHDQTGFTFYSNRTSRKGRDIAANPWASDIHRANCVIG
jgi:pyridoxamine 5'-phosphate oxidase